MSLATKRSIDTSHPVVLNIVDAVEELVEQLRDKMPGHRDVIEARETLAQTLVDFLYKAMEPNR